MRNKFTIILLLSLLFLPGCTFFRSIGGSFKDLVTPNRQNDFAEVNIKLKADEVEYTKHRLMIVDENGNMRDGVFTEVQYNKFLAFEKNVGLTDSPLHMDVLEWRTTGTKPVSFDSHAAALLKAQNELINFVKLEAVKP